MNQDQEHLRLLAIFHWVCAGLIALIAFFPVIHIVFGMIMLLRPQVFGPPGNQPPAFVGGFMVLIGGAIMCCGWVVAALLAWAGRCLSRRVNYSFCLVMAGVACLFMPFGTLLGVFTILVLARPSVKALFQPSGQPPAYT